ncbi:hypothetical protein M408DRAFT_330298 [Serendipita vermifera MAFF 305830]|uniref:Uncharacterized protein n=1 Tax=Serendipita vermifera MAFF 305830 TaxID=933852 RepID=A0A0C3AQV6_SERVB|nr:hypothetical protein M408DRAFT_330298 [Serendipita vermifera MAFF 305830]
MPSPTTTLNTSPFPPSYDSVAFAYPDEHVDKKSGQEYVPRLPASAAGTSSPSRELFTAATMPWPSEKELPAYSYDTSSTERYAPPPFPPQDQLDREALCQQSGGHVTRTRFGPGGIAAALLWFPLGLGAMWLDRKVTCERCQKVLRKGCTTRGCGSGKGKQRHHAERGYKLHPSYMTGEHLMEKRLTDKHAWKRGRREEHREYRQARREERHEYREERREARHQHKMERRARRRCEY